MKKYFENLAKALLGQGYKALDPIERKIIHSIGEGTTVTEDVNEAFDEKLTFGQKIADKIACFGGSWPFISLFFSFILLWIGINSYWLVSDAFDPYPYILLNLGLSTLASFQAPIIMMSQNRQAAKDRITQDSRYQIHLKIELDIMRLHEKIDRLLAEKNIQERL